MVQYIQKIGIFIFYGILIGMLLFFLSGIKQAANTAGFVLGGAVGGYISLWLWRNYGSKMI
jgi:hypothetical protein